MQAKKRKALEAAGWKVAGAREFLELSDTEAQLLEIKLALVKMLRLCRERNHLTQAQLAKKLDRANPVSQKWNQVILLSVWIC
jgi:hypothetical protein